MLARHIINYIPSLALPAAASFAAVYCYTRLLTPHEYGHYALAVNIMMMISAIFFYWLQIALPRLMPQAVREGREVQLRATSYIAFAASGIILLICAGIFTGLVPLGNLAGVAWLAVWLALARSLLNINQAFHRSALDFRRYNLIECGQAVLGLAAGLALVCFLHLYAAGAIIGLIIGMVCMLPVDAKALMRTSVRDFSRPALREIARYGLPLVGICSLTFIISSSDRFLIEYFQGAAEVGIYAAGYSLMDRIGQILFMAVATPSFPLLIHKLEQEGAEAARAQTYSNGVAMLALCLPACAGLALCNGQLATILIGEEFRAGAEQVMPWIAVSVILSGLSAHYFDHAFHLARKPYLLFLTQGPAAATNVLLNLIWIPRYGIIGAAYSTVCSYGLLLALSIIVGRRVFPIRFPFKPALQITGATALMACVLHAIPFPENASGLAAMIALGGAVYGLALLAFDVTGCRTGIMHLLKR